MLFAKGCILQDNVVRHEVKHLQDVEIWSMDVQLTNLS